MSLLQANSEKSSLWGIKLQQSERKRIMMIEGGTSMIARSFNFTTILWTTSIFNELFFFFQ
jgi:hypothetical protein